jgi:phosphatidylglycerol:prolipoprotein diacylglycerol transferase
LWALVGGLLAGRVSFVLANWYLFAEDWAQAIRIWEGGLSFHGAFLGGFLAIGIYAWFQRRDRDPAPFWQLTEVVTPGLALSIAFGWAACLMGGCAYGVVREGAGTMILPDLLGVEAPRFATQLVGLIYSLVLFAVFWLHRRRWPFDGAAFLMYVLFYFAGMFFLEFTRGDEAIYIGPWRLTQIIDVALVLGAAVGLLALWRLERKRKDRSGDGPAVRGDDDLKAEASPADV